MSPGERLNQPAKEISTLGAWWLAARPKTLTAAWAPVFVGSACAAAVDSFLPIVAVAALLGAALIQIATNFANDVFDYEKGADDEHRLGPTRAVQAGLLTPAQMRRGMVVTFALAMLVGVYLVGVGGWPIVVVGLASIASGVAYTGGPYPLGYNGLGDVFVMLFFGLVAVCCTAYLQVGSIPPESVPGALGIGALATAILVVNNVRDADTDVKAGKRTVVVRFGRMFGLLEYVAMMLLAFAAPVVLMLGFGFGASVLIGLATAPLGAVLTVKMFADNDGPTFNSLLAKTAALLLVYSVTLSVGIVLGAP
ncbi:MAG: 1,4-dihydroxy-2-naphthoate octaprenyltransferase [Bradymonadia bacterium]|jgi:1,4-dihydroxy-2-naphthoate octaprenyltransferase